VKIEQNIPLRKFGVREGPYKALDNIQTTAINP